MKVVIKIAFLISCLLMATPCSGVFAGNLDDQLPMIEYRTHVQNVGWQDWVKNGEISGTEGKGLRLEGFKLTIDSEYDLGLEYQTHIQNVGWQDWVSNGVISGTSGKGLRLEGIRIRLTGDDADKFDVFYQTQIQNVGWQENVKNGEMSGTSGKGLRLEGIRVVISYKENALKTVTYITDQDTVYKDETVLSGKTASTPDTPSKNEFTFAGWFTDSDFTTRYDFATPVVDNLKLYAKFEPIVPPVHQTKYYKVTLDCNNGKFDGKFGSSVERMVVEEGTAIRSPGIPALQGRSFAGWYTDRSFTKKWDINEDVVTSDMTLYAKWVLAVV